MERLLLDTENQVLETRITKYGNIPWVVQEAGGEGEGGGAPALGQGEPGP